MTQVGFIGIGNMGGPMAANLVKAGHEVHVFDLSEAAVKHAVDAETISSRRYESYRRLLALTERLEQKF